ncbi:MAG: hypothetical protein K0S75_2637 [Clostridia bacterium]|jgi:hypothetical protein|nr:hypothetical protein [Clostridia bacterium]
MNDRNNESGLIENIYGPNDGKEEQMEKYIEQMKEEIKQLKKLNKQKEKIEKLEREKKKIISSNLKNHKKHR